jgi:hypothetical protein
MANFLTRLAERTLGLATVAQPIVTPAFALALSDQLEDSTFNEVLSLGHTVDEEIAHEQTRPRVSPVNLESRRDEIPEMNVSALHRQHQDGIITPASIQDTSAADTPVHAPREVQVRRRRMETHDSYDHAGIVPLLVPPTTGIDLQIGHTHAPDNAPQASPVTLESLQDAPHTSFRAPTIPPTRQEKKNGLPISSAQHLKVATTEKPAPPIRVTIGRIEVRAIMPAKESAVRTPPNRPHPALSLDEYLKQRNGGQQ